jgi:hypothetical protein
MQKSYEFNRYPPSTYDEHLCLKPPLMLWLCILFLSRAVTLPFLIGLSSLGGGTSNTMQFVRGLFSTNTLFPSCIALAVLCALIRRSPSGPGWARWIWARGRLILALSAVLDFALALAGSPIWDVQLIQQAAMSPLTGALDLYFLAYLLASKRTRDTFSDFPGPSAS